MTVSQIKAKRVRYIKLGEGNRDAAACFERGIITLGFWTSEDDVYHACIASDWEIVQELLIARRTLQKQGEKPKSVADDLRQVREFFESDSNTVWITFSDRKLYWGIAEGTDASVVDLPTGKRTARPMKDGWKFFDLLGNALHMDDIAGHITMLSQYRGTICAVQDSDYLIRRINGERSVPYVKASETLDVLYQDVAAIIRSLTPNDFELLIEMIFVNTGWKRVGFAGRTEHVVDLILTRPSLDHDGFETVAVQIKSKTNQKEYERYEALLSPTYKRSYFVYHTGRIQPLENASLKLMDVSQIARLVVNSGLLEWLLARVK